MTANMGVDISDAMTTSRSQPDSPRRSQTIDWLPAAFLVVAILFLPVDANSTALNSLAIVFFSIVLEAIPFMLMGSLVGGMIEAFLSRERMTALLPKRGWQTVCVAAAAGILFPVCECAVVPVVRRLVGKGFPFAAAIGYLLGGPIVNPVVAASTALAYAFDWRMVALRLVGGYFLAVVIGLVMGRLFENTPALLTLGVDPVSSPFNCTHDSHVPACGCCSPHAASPLVDWMDKAGAAFMHAKNDFLAVGHYLVIGAFIAALAQTYVERSLFMGLADIPAVSVLLMMSLAILLNLCSEADAFIAASFQGMMPVSAQLAFLLTGPMLDLKLLLMYRSVFTKRAIVALAGLVAGMVFLFSMGYETLIGMRP
jgi:uncharacterized membrane protein YraQ (UPF0718 family)